MRARYFCGFWVSQIQIGYSMRVVYTECNSSFKSWFMEKIANLITRIQAWSKYLFPCYLGKIFLQNGRSSLCISLYFSQKHKMPGIEGASLLPDFCQHHPWWYLICSLGFAQTCKLNEYSSANLKSIHNTPQLSSVLFHCRVQTYRPESGALVLLRCV